MLSVYVSFTLDIVHSGHLKVLEKAAQLGKVTVGMLSDKAVVGHRSLPIVNYEQRKRIALGLKGVDRVVEQNEWSHVSNLLKYKPDFFVTGDDWKLNEPNHRESVIKALASYGGELVETEHEKDVTSATDRYLRSQQMTSSLRLSSLKRLIASKKIVRFIETHNPMSALIAETLAIKKEEERVEFDGFWSSSLTDSTSMGLPDIEVLDFSRRLNNINSIFDVTTKPMIYDGDTGGLDEHLAININSLQRIGVSAVIIEDKKGLKKNSLLGNEVSQSQDDIDSFRYVDNVIASPWKLNMEFFKSTGADILIHGDDNQNDIPQRYIKIYERTKSISSSLIRERVMQVILAKESNNKKSI